ncbi:hypothetical protein GWI33_011076, partial [Rhynchophorus ferrugineus]
LSDDFQYQAPIPNDINAWLDMAQRNNLDLNQRRVNYQVAQQQIKVDQASYYPQLEATASSTWSEQSPETQQDYVNAQYDYILNVLQLRADSGQLDEQDLQQLNAWLE